LPVAALGYETNILAFRFVCNVQTGFNGQNANLLFSQSS
jgi:hypothetical protein